MRLLARVAVALAASCLTGHDVFVAARQSVSRHQMEARYTDDASKIKHRIEGGFDHVAASGSDKNKHRNAGGLNRTATAKSGAVERHAKMSSNHTAASSASVVSHRSQGRSNQTATSTSSTVERHGKSTSNTSARASSGTAESDSKGRQNVTAAGSSNVVKRRSKTISNGTAVSSSRKKSVAGRKKARSLASTKQVTAGLDGSLQVANTDSTSATKNERNASRSNGQKRKAQKTKLLTAVKKKVEADKLASSGNTSTGSRAGPYKRGLPAQGLQRDADLRTANSTHGKAVAKANSSKLPSRHLSHASSAQDEASSPWVVPKSFQELQRLHMYLIGFLITAGVAALYLHRRPPAKVVRLTAEIEKLCSSAEAIAQLACCPELEDISAGKTQETAVIADTEGPKWHVALVANPRVPRPRSWNSHINAWLTSEVSWTCEKPTNDDDSNGSLHIQKVDAIKVSGSEVRLLALTARAPLIVKFAGRDGPINARAWASCLRTTKEKLQELQAVLQGENAAEKKKAARLNI